MVAVVWFKRDLRVTDHAPLFHATRNHGDVYPLYAVEPDLWKQPDTSRRHWHFIQESLIDLRQDLLTLNMPLLIRMGPILETLQHLKETLGPFTLYSHEETGNMWTYERDIAVGQWCKTNDISWMQYQNNGVVRRLKDRNLWTSHHKAFMDQNTVTTPKPQNHFPNMSTGEIPPKDHPLFGPSVTHVQKGGRKEGIKILQSFLSKRATQYRRSISKPEAAKTFCSRLSPHITYGTLSIREIFHQCWGTLRSLKDTPGDHMYLARGIRAMTERLYWHCHFIQKLEDQPGIEAKCMHPAFEGMRDGYHSESFLKAWHEGKTGYPLVDASMRCLHETGWLNFRMRAMVVSFASYHLLLDWRHLSPLLACLFTDYEPGIHFSQLQMQSGVTGINAIRIYNPVKQSYDQDPEGIFIRKHVPALRNVPTTWIHEPWKMDPMKQREIHCIIGKDYPETLVEHTEAVRKARALMIKVRKQDEFKATSRAVFEKHGSRKKSSRSPRKKPVKSNNQLTLFD